MSENSGKLLSRTGSALPDDGLVEDGVRFRRGDECKRRVLSNNVIEFLVVDVERLGRERLLGYTWPKEELEGSKHCQPRTNGWS